MKVVTGGIGGGSGVMNDVAIIIKKTYQRLSSKKQTLDDAYAVPANFLEIDVINPITHGVANKRYTDYECRLKTNLPVFRVKESSVRRR